MAHFIPSTYRTQKMQLYSKPQTLLSTVVSPASGGSRQNTGRQILTGQGAGQVCKRQDMGRLPGKVVSELSFEGDNQMKWENIPAEGDNWREFKVPRVVQQSSMKHVEKGWGKMKTEARAQWWSVLDTKPRIGRFDYKDSGSHWRALHCRGGGEMVTTNRLLFWKDLGRNKPLDLTKK